MKKMTDEDLDELVACLNEIVMNSCNNGDSGSTFQNNVETETSNLAIDMSNDGVVHSEEKPQSPLIELKDMDMPTFDESSIVPDYGDTNISDNQKSDSSLIGGTYSDDSPIKKELVSEPDVDSSSDNIISEAHNYIHSINESDSANSVSDSTVEKPVNTRMFRVIRGGLDNKSQKILDDTVSDIQKRDSNLKAYYKTTKDRQPIFQKDIEDEFGSYKEIKDDELYKSLRASGINPEATIGLKPQPKTDSMKRAERVAAQSSKTDWVDNKSCYAENTCECNGRTIVYKDRAERVNWGAELANLTLSSEEAIEKLKNLVTKSVRDGYGGWGRINSIIVRDQKLIINNVAFLPVIEPKYLNDKVFPWDVLDYLKNGSIAMFFDWWCLKYMNDLTLLDIDDVNLFVSTIDTDLGCRGRIGVSTMYRTCKRLNTFILGGEVTTRDTLYKSDSRGAKESVARGHRARNLFAGLQLDVVGATGRFQDYTFNNMVNYATSRGDKGLLRFCGGTLARASLAGAALITNVGSHLVKGIINVFKDSTRPVTEDDMYN